VLALLVVAAAAVGLLPDLLGLDGRSPFAQLVAFRPALLGGLLVLAVGATVAAGARKRGWTLAVGLLAVAAVGTVQVAPRALAGVTVPEPDAPTRPALTVLTFNTYEGQADVDAVAALIRDTKPDLIALPESAGRFVGKLAPLAPGYRFSPSQARGRDVQGVTAAVRADLGDVTVQVDRSTGFPSVTVSGGGLGTLRFVAFHSIAPTPGAVPEWRSDLAAVPRWCADPQPGPVIIAGDFNSTLDHSAFRAATAGCTDSAERSGDGLVGTWPSRLPRWLGPQIDHVLVAGGITPETVSVHDVPGSDHRAVLARLLPPS
jgi:endonuclease/exonuclease/phosphatase (EEP) superfamily protein YafD